jgi:hypothetical protein
MLNSKTRLPSQVCANLNRAKIEEQLPAIGFVPPWDNSGEQWLREPDQMAF